MDRSERWKAPLPTIAVIVWKRLPPTSLTDPDLCALTVFMMEMKNRLEELTTQLPAMIKSQLSSWRPFIQPTHVSLEQPGSSSNKLYTDQPLGSSKSTIIISEGAKVIKPIIAPQTSSWAALAANCTESQFNPVVSKRKPAAHPVRIVGKRPMLTDSKVHSAPRRLTAFVGRLHIRRGTGWLPFCSWRRRLDMQETRCKRQDF